jgi:hypothetical protein
MPGCSGAAAGKLAALRAAQKESGRDQFAALDAALTST